ncbi:MAG: SgcJ/EcaC family oxidoreductase [Micromonosporaceae bacterium]
MAGEPRFPRYGIVDVEDDLCVVRFERYLAHPIDAVWTALTTPAALTGWWGEAQFDFVQGGEFVMSWFNTDDTGNRAVLHGTITALEPPRLLEITGDIHGVLRFELAPDGDGTHLRFSSTLHLPAEYRTKVLAGWHYHLDALATLLRGGTNDLVNVTGWDAIHEQYLDRVLSPADEKAVRALYHQILDGWNNASGEEFAAAFAPDGEAIGFDGSRHAGREGIASDLQKIFANHTTATYVAKIKNVRLLAPRSAALRAIAGLVPPGQSDIRPELNAVQMLVATQRDGDWRVAIFQNTPAQFHGRPELMNAMTEELREVLRASRARATPGQ